MNHIGKLNEKLKFDFMKFTLPPIPTLSTEGTEAQRIVFFLTGAPHNLMNTSIIDNCPFVDES